MEKKYIRGKKDEGVETPVDADYSMLVEDVVRCFAEEGVRRSPRMIGRYCSEGQLICDYRSDDRRWHINPDSVEERIKILKRAQKEAQRAVTGRSSESSTETVNEIHKSVSVNKSGEKIAKIEKENEDLKEENINLRIADRVKNEQLKIMSVNLDKVEVKLDGAIGELNRLNYQLGALEMELKLLKSPRTKTIEVTDAEHAEHVDEPTSRTSPISLEGKNLMNKHSDSYE